MSAQAFVLQMVRAHFRRDDSAFAYAANALGRTAKSSTIRNEIAELTRRGFVTAPGSGPSRASQPYRSGGSSKEGEYLASSSALRPLAPVSFEDLLLPEAIQAYLDEIVEELEYRTHLAERGLDARSRLLFHGPPGNGKTSTAAAVANALGVEAYVVSIPEVLSIFVGGTSKQLGALFREIRDGMVVVFDELDAIGSSRGAVSSSAGKESNAIVNTLLTLLDQHKGGVIVATTNRPDIIDPALLRRFDEQMLFPPPSREQKEALALKLSTQFEISPVDVTDCENLDEVTKRVKTEARRIVMRELRAAEDEDPEDDHGDDAMH